MKQHRGYDKVYDIPDRPGCRVNFRGDLNTILDDFGNIKHRE
jgi:hypothetical protein